MRHCVRIRLTFTRPYFGHREQQVEDLGRLQPLGRIEQEPVDLGPSGLEVSLERCATGTDLVRALQRVHALGERAFGSRTRRVLGGRLGGRHEARLYTRPASRFGSYAHFSPNSSGPQAELQGGCGYLTLFGGLCRAFCDMAPISGRSRRGKNPRSDAENAASSEAIRRPAAGSRKFSVPTATQRAPAARKSRASRPLAMPPMPTTGIETRRATDGHLLERDRRAPRARIRRRCRRPSHGRPLAGSSAIPLSVLISATASAPAPSRRRGHRGGVGGVGRELDDQRLLRERAQAARPSARSPPGRRP